jgi:hypothetical protein
MKNLSKTKMKLNLKVVILLTIAGFSALSAQQNNINKDINMYTRVWDDILNNRKLEQINDTYFDTEILLVTSPENIVGIDNVKAYYSNFLTGFSDIEFGVVKVFGQGDEIVKHWNFKGTHTGEFFGIPATGKPVDINGVTLVKMKNGKIAREHDFMDNMVFMQQLGLLSNPGNLNVIDRAYKAFATGDIPAVLAAMDANVVWNEAEGNAYADGNPYIGPEAILNGIFARIAADYEYFKLTDIQLHDMADNKVLATLRYHGKLRKNMAMINVQVAHLWTLGEGKVIGFQQYADTKQLADANR